MAAYKAFREPSLVSDLIDVTDFSEWGARRMRYALLWSFFENTAYRRLHTWAKEYKKQYGLYRYVRGIYNPASRLGTFWQTHLMGGMLDSDAGDGVGVPSALPISTDIERLRPVIAQIWADSNWHVRKDTYTLLGAVLGDVALEVVDDTERGRAYLRVVRPSTLKEVTRDDLGYVKGYVIEEEKEHPEKEGVAAIYREECTRDGDNVVYRTYLDNSPYAWPGQDDGDGEPVDEWQHPYGFVPMVVVQHYDVGLDWGWAEMHAGRSKFHEVDDLASKLSDQVRKSVDAKWLFAGVDAPAETPTIRSQDTDTYQDSDMASDKPEPGREELGALYGPAGASAHALVYPLDIAGTFAYINGLLGELERDFPELQMDIWTAAGDASGRALRVARQRVEVKVRQRRVNYDDALVRAQQMAMSIGGFRGYDGFAGISLDSYGRGELDHDIAARPVFMQDPIDDSEIKAAFWTAAKEAVATGIPLRFYLEEEAGWDEDKLKRFDEAQQSQTFVLAGGEGGAPPWQPEQGAGEDETEE